MQVFCTITAKNGARVPIDVANDATPTTLRQQVAAATKIPLAALRLIFRGKMIKDDDSIQAIEEYKLEADCVLHCMGKPVEEEAAPAAPTVAIASTNATTTPSSTAEVPPPSTASAAQPAAVVPPVPAAAPAAATATIGANRSVSAAILRLRTNNPPSVYQTALTTLEKILSNIVGHPMEEKYRKVKRQNPAFQKRLGGLVGGHDCMLAVGFKVELDGGAEAYQLRASPEQWPKLVQAKTDVEQAARQAQLQQAAMPAAGGNNMFGAPPLPSANNPMGGMGGMGGGNMPAMDPMMQQQMQQMMSNPQALRSAMQNPMMQEMIRNNPNITPQMRSQFEMVANNPAMIDQIAQQMQNPAAMAQMQAMMNARGGGAAGLGSGLGGGAGSGMPANPGTFGAPAPAPSGSTNNSSNPPAQGNDQSQTEEEMIAEAIRRSLEDS